MKIFNLILLVLLALNMYSCREKAKLPVYTEFPAMALQDPLQTATSRPSFSVMVEDQQHTVKPIFYYRICGMVVSAGFSKHQAEYRKDKLNTMDVGILWGRNLDPAIYKNMEFQTDGVWLKAKTKDRNVWERFDQAQLSNNHLLSIDPLLTKRVKALKPGDLISIKGYLANYSGRTSSVIRSDIGTTACEIVWVDEVSVLQDGTRAWHRLHKATLYGMALLFIVKCMLFFRSPPPAPGK